MDTHIKTKKINIDETLDIHNRQIERFLNLFVFNQTYGEPLPMQIYRHLNSLKTVGGSESKIVKIDDIKGNKHEYKI